MVEIVAGASHVEVGYDRGNESPLSHRLSRVHDSAILHADSMIREKPIRSPTDLHSSVVKRKPMGLVSRWSGSKSDRREFRLPLYWRITFHGYRFFVKLVNQFHRHEGNNLSIEFPVVIVRRGRCGHLHSSDLAQKVPLGTGAHLPNSDLNMPTPQKRQSSLRLTG
jgi:hypothetical protein